MLDCRHAKCVTNKSFIEKIDSFFNYSHPFLKSYDDILLPPSFIIISRIILICMIDFTGHGEINGDQ